MWLRPAARLTLSPQAANILQLLTFVRADVSVFQPKPAPLTDADDAGYNDAFGVDAPAEPRFPKSLFLVRPLFGAYELGPVAAQAQASVPVPEGLDLAAWIVPPPADALARDVDEGEDALVGKKKKKGKGKETAGAKPKRKKRREGELEDGMGGDALTPSVVETEEEKAERERVSLLRGR